MPRLKIFLDSFLYSNIFIALCALGLTVASLVIGGGSFQENAPVLFFVFFSTLASYSLHAILRSNEPADDERISFIRRHKKGLFLLTAGSIGAGIAASFWLSSVQIFLAAQLAVLSFFYTVGLSFRGKIHPLSHLPYAKIFLIAYAWTVLTVLMPLWNILPVSELWLLAFQRFLLISALAIPFDMRDISKDRAMGVKTIPALLGNEKAGILMFTLFLILAIVELFSGGGGFHLYALAVIILSLAVIFPFLLRKRHPYWFSLGVDGMMLLYAGFLLGSVFFLQ